MSEQVQQMTILVAENSLQFQVLIRPAFPASIWQWCLSLVTYGKELLDYLPPDGTQE